MLEQKYVDRVAKEVGVSPDQAQRTISLFDDGATIPFIARYRKDVTGNLNEEQLESIHERNTYYNELTERKKFVLDTIGKQGKLSDELRASIEACEERTALEDLYLPYKKAKRTKATVAKDKGLMPLAELLWQQVLGDQTLDEVAATFVSTEKRVPTAEDALEGARHILAERVSVTPDVRAALRERMMGQGTIVTKPTKAGESAKSKFKSYHDFREAVKTIPSHRFLAIQRGVKEGKLRMELAMDDEAFIEETVAAFLKEPGSAFQPHVREFVADAFQRLLRPSIEKDVLREVQRRSDEEAVRVFRENAQNLLLSPPAGQIPVIGLDPGLRSGCKLAVVDANGTYQESAVIHPGPPQNDFDGASRTLMGLMDKYGVRGIAIGNGTGAREAAAFVRKALQQIPDKEVFSVLVNEAGASIYSASPVAREEYPELDVTIRGAISIAHRLQDPLSELVKIDPKHIGVGQYQHDVNQKLLRDSLQLTVVSCVSNVGVDLNTASAPLLRYVSGIKSKLARNIVARREEKGAFKSRAELMEVEGIGPKVFEQCAGFLRIQDGEEPLDATGIHPEAYDVVKKLSETAGVDYPELIRNTKPLENVDLTQFASGAIGALTLEDIRAELARPGRDPRKEFKAPRFMEGVTEVSDLKEGMDVEGVVTNVTDFGAFVDIGVHQDGLVHLSEMAHRFVKDPHAIAKVGDIIKVRVIKVDPDAPRISLSMKALAPKPESAGRGRPGETKGRNENRRTEKPESQKSEGKPKGRKGRKPKKQQQKNKDSRKPKVATAGDKKSGQLNTALADQLASLKDRFNAD